MKYVYQYEARLRPAQLPLLEKQFIELNFHATVELYPLSNEKFLLKVSWMQFICLSSISLGLVSVQLQLSEAVLLRWSFYFIQLSFLTLFIKEQFTKTKALNLASTKHYPMFLWHPFTVLNTLHSNNDMLHNTEHALQYWTSNADLISICFLCRSPSTHSKPSCQTPNTRMPLWGVTRSLAS